MVLLNPDCKQKLLKKNHRTGLPGRVIYFDTETRTKVVGSITKHRMQLAWTCLTDYNPFGGVLKEKWILWTDSKKMC